MAKNTPPKLNVTIPGAANAGPYGLGPLGDRIIEHANSLVGAPAHSGPSQNAQGHPNKGRGGLTLNQILDYMHTLQTTDPKTLGSLQTLLYRGGFYPATYKFLPGVVKAQDQAALIAALKQVVNTPGRNLVDYLTNAATIGDQLGINAAGATRAPLVKQFTSPTDIQSVVETVAPQVIGRNLAPGEVARIVSGYHALESSSQDAAYNANDAAGTSYTAPPSVQDYVQQQTRVLHPDEAVATDRAGVADNFLKVLNWGTPSTAAY